MTADRHALTLPLAGFSTRAFLLDFVKRFGLATADIERN